MLLAFVSTGFTIGLLYVLLVAPYQLAKGILLMNEDEVAGSKRFKAMCPVINIFYAEKEFGRSFPIVGISSLLTVLTFITNCVLMFVAPMAVYLRMGVLMAFMVFAIVMYVSSCIMTSSLLSATDELFGVKKLLYILFFPLGYFYIGNYLWKYVLNDVAKLNAVDGE